MDGALRAFDGWLNGGGPDGLLRWSLPFLVLVPALTAVHELGPRRSDSCGPKVWFTPTWGASRADFGVESVGSS